MSASSLPSKRRGPKPKSVQAAAPIASRRPLVDGELEIAKILLAAAVNDHLKQSPAVNSDTSKRKAYVEDMYARVAVLFDLVIPCSAPEADQLRKYCYNMTNQSNVAGRLYAGRNLKAPNKDRLIASLAEACAAAAAVLAKPVPADIFRTLLPAIPVHATEEEDLSRCMSHDGTRIYSLPPPAASASTDDKREWRRGEHAWHGNLSEDKDMARLQAAWLHFAKKQELWKALSMARLTAALRQRPSDWPLLAERVALLDAHLVHVELHIRIPAAATLSCDEYPDEVVAAMVTRIRESTATWRQSTYKVLENWTAPATLPPCGLEALEMAARQMRVAGTTAGTAPATFSGDHLPDAPPIKRRKESVAVAAMDDRQEEPEQAQLLDDPQDPLAASLRCAELIHQYRTYLHANHRAMVEGSVGHSVPIDAAVSVAPAGSDLAAFLSRTVAIRQELTADLLAMGELAPCELALVPALVRSSDEVIQRILASQWNERDSAQHACDRCTARVMLSTAKANDKAASCARDCRLWQVQAAAEKRRAHVEKVFYAHRSRGLSLSAAQQLAMECVDHPNVRRVAAADDELVRRVLARERDILRTFFRKAAKAVLLHIVDDRTPQLPESWYYSVWSQMGIPASQFAERLAAQRVVDDERRIRMDAEAQERFRVKRRSANAELRRLSAGFTTEPLQTCTGRAGPALLADGIAAGLAAYRDYYIAHCGSAWPAWTAALNADLQQQLAHNIRHCYAELLRGARGVHTDLTLRDWLGLWFAPCIYCGDTATATDGYRLDQVEQREMSHDRRNVVPACGACNMARGAKLSVTAFVEHCAAIALYRRIASPVPSTTVRSHGENGQRGMRGKLARYRDSASRKTAKAEAVAGRKRAKAKDDEEIGLTKRPEWLLSDEQVYDLFRSDCWYCGMQPSGGRCSGIDRQDSFGAYVAWNVVSCCSTCNYAKRATSVDAFLGRCRSIALRWGLAT